mmetsp:Transcript_52190/g.137835  ORF Transcript_52190/g.137835 Transcript_52190/m.137835 type:complete len:157 (-) Transcript_52190:112-582(-)
MPEQTTGMTRSEKRRVLEQRVGAGGLGGGAAGWRAGGGHVDVPEAAGGELEGVRDPLTGEIRERSRSREAQRDPMEAKRLAEKFAALKKEEGPPDGADGGKSKLQLAKESMEREKAKQALKKKEREEIKNKEEEKKAEAKKLQAERKEKGEAFKRY